MLMIRKNGGSFNTVFKKRQLKILRVNLHIINKYRTDENSQDLNYLVASDEKTFNSMICLGSVCINIY